MFLPSVQSMLLCREDHNDEPIEATNDQFPQLLKDWLFLEEDQN